MNCALNGAILEGYRPEVLRFLVIALVGSRSCLKVSVCSGGGGLQETGGRSVKMKKNYRVSANFEVFNSVKLPSICQKVEVS